MKNKMARSEIEEIVKKVIISQVGKQKNKTLDEINIQDKIDFDSLDLIMIVIELENAFNIEIPDEKIKNLYTINDVIDYIEKMVK